MIHFDTVGSLTVTNSLAVTEIPLVSGIDVTDVQDYIDGSGNITMRIEVPGPLNQSYQVSFDQLLVRCLREDENS